jgi:nodulation protein A
MVRADGRVQVYGGVSMVLAVRREIGEWPAGRVDRNGWEV